MRARLSTLRPYSRAVPCGWRAAAAVAFWLIVALAPSPATGAKAPGAPAWADLGADEDLSGRAVQERQYALDHEIALLVGALPSDPFYKGLALTGGYALHFSPYIAWEVLAFSYVLDFDTNLRNQLRLIIGANIGTAPPFPEVRGLLASHLVLKPFYGKQALQDAALAHVEVFAQLGPAVMALETLQGRTYAGGLDWGLGIRLWLSPSVSLRLQMGQAVFYLRRSVRQALHVDGGLSFNLGGAE